MPKEFDSEQLFKTESRINLEFKVFFGKIIIINVVEAKERLLTVIKF